MGTRSGKRLIPKLREPRSKDTEEGEGGEEKSEDGKRVKGQSAHVWRASVVGSGSVYIR